MTYSIFHSTRALQAFLEIAAVLAVIAAWSFRHARGVLCTSLEARLAAFASQRPRAILAAALFPMIVRLLLLPAFPIPEPRVHDEFSYLLLGDTLVHGRLANPTPPSWRHFETEYELVRPTYASQYEPGQGLVLAAGEGLAGNPWWGVWLSAGFMCGALCWALGRALPDRWALFGALLAGLQFGIFGFWMNSYFGGALCAAGGALIFGSIQRRKSVGSAVTAALGLAIVLSTRPAEGLIWSLTLAAVCMFRPFGLRIRPAVFLLTLAPCIAALTFYNAKITGNPFRAPYEIYRDSYGTPQSYWWQPAAVVKRFDNAELAANYEDQLGLWRKRYSSAALWDSTWRRLRDFWRFFIGPFLTPAMIFALFAIRRRRLRPWVWLSALFILDHATYHAWYPQQSASETVLIVLFLVEGWRNLRAWRPRMRTGFALSRGLAGGFAAASLALCVGLFFLPAAPRSWITLRRVWDTMTPSLSKRGEALARLAAVPGKHLVFVRYSADHPWYDEWVFNGADIPGSKVVFARMCSPESDRALANTMADRDVWIANPDAGPLIARVSSAQLLLASIRLNSQP